MVPNDVYASAADELRPVAAMSTAADPYAPLQYGLALSGVRANWDRWTAMGVRYVVSLHVIDRLPGSLGYRVLYESPRLRLRVLELPGAQAVPDRK